jgi:hypothetical protein
MNSVKKPFIDKDSMGKNPFIANQIIKARQINRGKTIIIETNEGINMPIGELQDVNIVEEQSYTKLFHDVDFRDRLLQLKENELKLAIHIMYQIIPNEDFIWINIPLFMRKSQIRDRRLYQLALEGLIRYALLTPTTYKDTYWINPLIFFSGNRLKKYTDNIKLRV